MDNKLFKAYASWPMRLCIIMDTKIVFCREHGPLAYNPKHTDDALIKLLNWYGFPTVNIPTMKATNDSPQQRENHYAPIRKHRFQRLSWRLDGANAIVFARVQTWAVAREIEFGLSRS